MKPLKGMNQDISSASKTEATYTKAMNFVYGKELDALLQEPGMELLLSAQSADETATGIIGCVSLRNDNFLLFTYRVEGEYSQIKKYNSLN